MLSPRVWTSSSFFSSGSAGAGLAGAGGRSAAMNCWNCSRVNPGGLIEGGWGAGVVGAGGRAGVVVV